MQCGTATQTPGSLGPASREKKHSPLESAAEEAESSGDSKVYIRAKGVFIREFDGKVTSANNNDEFQRNQ